MSLPIALATTELAGVDIYHGDHVNDWSALARVAQFICIKATESTTFHDPSYLTHIANARNAGLIAGSYHFIDMSQDGAVQADNFIAQILLAGGVRPGEWVALDWETSSGDPYSVTGDPVVIQAFLERVKAVLGQRCFIYASHALTNETGNPAFLSEYPLWLVDYSGHPRVPAPWTTWNIWQSSGSASIAGLDGTGDLDAFQGDLNDLKTLIAYCKV